MTKKEPIYTKSSGNIFKDIGFSDNEAEELLKKAKILLQINKLTGSGGTPVKDLSRLLKLKTSEAIDMRKGRAHKFSTENLERHLNFIKSILKTLKNK